LATNTLKQFAILGSALALLGGCASQQEKPAEAPKPAVEAPKPDPEAAARAAAEKKAAEEAAARAAAEKQAAEEAEAKRRAAAAAPPPAPAAPKVTTLKSTGMFDFDKSVLRPDAKAALDKDVVARKDEVKSVKSVIVDGHADRLGSHEYNQRLSEKRAEVAKAYLVGKGVPANSIETNGFGKTQPATGAGVQKCEDSLGRKKLIECLQPHRRVVVELKGEAK
jgi:OmpA-OmpF porin, OOP family